MPSLRPRKLPYDAEAARRHLTRRDPVMRQIVKRIGPLDLELRGTPYQTLMRALLYQQLAGPAAAAIERRFLALYGNQPPEPNELLATTPEKLARSRRLAAEGVATSTAWPSTRTNGGLELRKLNRLPDDDVIARVTEVKGIGRWTADMLLMFCLGRSGRAAGRRPGDPEVDDAGVRP